MGKSTFISNMLGLADTDPTWLERVQRLPSAAMLERFSTSPQDLQYYVTVPSTDPSCSVKLVLQVGCLSLFGMAPDLRMQSRPASKLLLLAASDRHPSAGHSWHRCGGCV